MPKEPVSTLSLLDGLFEKIEKRRVTLEPSMVLDGDTKVVTVRFDPKKYKSLELMMLTDLQFGHIAFNETRFREFTDWILSEPNRFVFLGGDLIDSATPLSVGSPYENKWEPSTQVIKLMEILTPLYPRILASVGGNHERRTTKTFGDAGRLIATLMKIPYSRGVQFIDIHYGEHDPFKVSLWHGTGAAQTKGAKAQMLHRFMGRADSQLYLVGHLHDVVLLYDWRQLRRNKRIKLQKIAGVMSSSFMDYWNTYAEVAGLPPSDTMMALAILEPSGRWTISLR